MGHVRLHQTIFESLPLCFIVCNISSVKALPMCIAIIGMISMGKPFRSLTILGRAGSKTSNSNFEKMNMLTSFVTLHFEIIAELCHLIWPCSLSANDEVFPVIQRHFQSVGIEQTVHGNLSALIFLHTLDVE
jgi:hypothetical protein